MCGIMAYVGKREAYPVLIDGLKTLEYRGYDSSGVAIMNGSLSVIKTVGKVEALEQYAIGKKTSGNIGLGHTRWATHGEPSEINAHPHQSQSGRYTIVHNGIIENYVELKQMMMNDGFAFLSRTDTEVLVQLIQWHQQRFRLQTREALVRSMELLEGSFAIVLFDAENVNKLWVARKNSPLAIGFGESECYISSDTLALSAHVNRVTYLEDATFAELFDDGQASFYNFDGSQYSPTIEVITKDKSVADKGQYESFMLKEINEQPQMVENLISTWSDLNLQVKDRRIVFVACGTSWNSALLAKYLIEEHARVQVNVEYASEFRYRNPVLSSDDLVVAISQSGETADTIAGIELALGKGCETVALVNVRKSTLDRLCDHSIYLQAGREIGVASTKAFTNQVVTITKLVAAICQKDNPELACKIEEELIMLPSLIRECLDTINITEVVEQLAYSKSALFLGRGPLFPISVEGALKLKEITYIHAESYAAGEMKHGPIALIDKDMPVIAICMDDNHLSKMISNIQEVKARNAKVIIIKSSTVKVPEGLADTLIDVHTPISLLAPVLLNIPLQLIAHDVAITMELDVDKPRNLAKSVTVE